MNSTTRTQTQPPVRTAEFGPLRIAWDERVLRPRAWTVGQSHQAAEVLADAPAGPVLELCCGAGQIGLLAAALTARPLVAVDVDPVACDYTRRNALAAGLEAQVEVREGPMDAVLGEGDRFALVLADPPWVRRGETGRFPEDPLRAIDGGADGLALARACVRTAAAHLLPGGSLLLQLGSTEQADALAADLARAGLSARGVRQHDGGVVAWATAAAADR